MHYLEDVLIKPIMSEKASMLSEQQNRFAFVVSLQANKHQIKAAVEKLFDVKVLKVTTSIVPGKVKRFRNGLKKSSNEKKAYVQVKEGQKIEFFKGI